MPYDTRSVLPDPSILKKLTIVDPVAAEWVFNRFETVCEERRNQESVMASKAFRAGFVRAFRFVSVLRQDFNQSSNAWEQTGNNLRKAILDYCEVFPENAQKAGLTEIDRKALDISANQKAYSKISKPRELHA